MEFSKQQNDESYSDCSDFRKGAQISRWTGEFVKPANESEYLKEIWPLAVRQARRALVAAILILIFSFLPIFLTNSSSESHIVAGAAKIIFLAMAVSLISIPKVINSLRAYQWLVFGCAIAMAATDAVILFSGEIDWGDYILIVAAELVFFALFLTNTFSFALFAELSIFTVFIASGWLAGADKPVLLLFALALFVFTLFCISHYVRTNRWARSNYYKTKTSNAAREELEKFVLDSKSEHEAVEKAAAENVMLMEELAFTQQDAEEKSTFLKAVLDNISQGVSVFDKNLNLVVWNKNYKDILDLPEDFLVVGRNMKDIIRVNAERGEYGDEDVENAIKGRMARIKDCNAIEKHNYERQRADGTYIEIHGNPMPGGGLVATYSDITERKKNEEIIRQMALHDSLTGLANRNRFNQKLTEKTRISRRDKCRVGLALLDLDGFKQVNDSFGHPAGDDLLKQVAGILIDAVREVDTVARLGGDEFAIIFHGIGEKECIDIPLARIIERLSEPMFVEGNKVQIGVSIGVGFLPDDADNEETLIRRTDEMLYRAKHAGKGCFVKISDDPENIKKRKMLTKA